MALPTATPDAPTRIGGALRYRRIVVKAGTNVLTRKTTRLDLDVMASLAGQIADVAEMGAQVALVTSGAIAAGREAAPAVAKGKGVPTSQMLAAIGQSRLMHAYRELFAERGIIVAQALLTARDVEDRVGYLNARNTLKGLMERGVVPIVNENDVVDTQEIATPRFGDNDTLSAMAANVVDADLLLILTDTGGLFTADPNRDPSAKPVRRVERIDDSVMALAEPLEGGPGRGGMASKLRAARQAASIGVAVMFGRGESPTVVREAACGTLRDGTCFPPTAAAAESRKRWLLSGMTKKDAALVVDGGAERALAGHARSLLPAGVREVRGRFLRGDVVEVVSEDGARIAYGIANYDSSELRKIAGERSERIAELLGHHHGDEAIHRNNLVAAV